MCAKYLVAIYFLLKFCENNADKDSGYVGGRGMIGSVAFPKWRGYKKNQDIQKEGRFWPPVPKESRCKYFCDRFFDYRSYYTSSLFSFLLFSLWDPVLIAVWYKYLLFFTVGPEWALPIKASLAFNS